MADTIDLPLPPVELRWGGPRYRDDATYRSSGAFSARLLEKQCGITKRSRVLDVGCGPGRLLTGLVDHFGSIGRYVGVDVYEPAISWLKREVSPVAPFAEFHRVEFPNARYNPNGASRNINLSLGEFDCISLFSVFSHMMLADIAVYLPFLRNHLAPNGRVYLTAFVEDGVEPEVENPKDYHREWSGALHCVRLNRQIFEEAVTNANLQIYRFEYRHTNDGQSSYLIGRKTAFEARVVT